MILDSYYKFEKLPNKGRGKTRRDLVAFTNHYEPLHKANKAGDVWVYLNNPDHIQSKLGRRPEQTISNTGHVSSVFKPDLEHPDLGYGDSKDTTDALLFVFSPDLNCLEIFIAKGKKHIMQNLFTVFVDGELDSELETLRHQAKVFRSGEMPEMLVSNT